MSQQQQEQVSSTPADAIISPTPPSPIVPDGEKSAQDREKSAQEKEAIAQKKAATDELQALAESAKLFISDLPCEASPLDSMLVLGSRGIVKTSECSMPFSDKRMKLRFPKEYLIPGYSSKTFASVISFDWDEKNFTPSDEYAWFPVKPRAEYVGAGASTSAAAAAAAESAELLLVCGDIVSLWEDATNRPYVITLFTVHKNTRKGEQKNYLTMSVMPYQWQDEQDVEMVRYVNEKTSWLPPTTMKRTKATPAFSTRLIVRPSQITMLWRLVGGPVDLETFVSAPHLAKQIADSDSAKDKDRHQRKKGKEKGKGKAPVESESSSTDDDDTNDESSSQIKKRDVLTAGKKKPTTATKRANTGK